MCKTTTAPTTATPTTTTPREGNNGKLHRPENPLHTAGCLSRLFFWWAKSLLSLGYRQALEESDLWELSSAHTSSACRQTVEGIWERCNGDFPQALFFEYWRSTLWNQLFIGISMGSRIVQSIALGYLIEQFAVTGTTDENKNEGYLWVALIVVFGLTGMLGKQHAMYGSYSKGMTTRAGLVSAIYHKALRLSSIAGNKASAKKAGEITNLASNDVERFFETSIVTKVVLVIPFESAAIIVVGVGIIGWSFIAGYVMILLCLPLQMYFSRRFRTIRREVAAITDARVSFVSQAVSGARVMKMNAWENQFEERIAAIREREVRTILKGAFYKAVNDALYFCGSAVIAVVIFAIYIHVENEVLTPRKVFTILSLINLLQFSILRHIPLAVMGLSESYVSSKRIQEFFELPDLPTPSFQPNMDPDQPTLTISNVTCYWNFMEHQQSGETKQSSTTSNGKNINPQGQEEQLQEDDTIALDDIHLSLFKDQLLCIVGKVGSGKSALLQCIAGELPPSSGEIVRNYESMAFSAQEPWIMDGSVRENITFGLPFRPDWYQRVVEACGLVEDLSTTFLHGDRTVVGDRGIQCSGGQRARIGLARALYRDADLLLLDDPLSAVDSKVARWIYYSAIQDLAVKRGKCVVLATHQHQFVGNSACVLMDGGKIQCHGSYADCVEASDGLLKAALQTEQQEGPTAAVVNEENEDFKFNASEAANLLETNKIAAKVGSSDAAAIQDDAQKEKRDVGVVRAETWYAYIRAMGGFVTFILYSILFSGTQVLQLVSIVEIGKWADLSASDQASLYQLGIMVGLVVALVLISVLRASKTISLFINASQSLHDKMTHAVLRSKIEFFDTNPIGRILNRFSADMGITDELLPMTLYNFLVGAFIALGGVATALAVLPFIVAVLPPLCIYFVMLRRLFLKSVREVKRLEGMSRSPIFAMMSEALGGIGVIRSNNGVDFFRKKFEEVHNAHTRAFCVFVGATRWFATQLDVLTFLLMSMASILAVVFHQQGWFDIDPAVLGLALTMLLQVAGTNFPWVIRQSAEVTNQMISVERIQAFGLLPSEAPLFLDEDEGKYKEWPTRTSIEANNLTVRYRDNLPPALAGLSFRIEGGSKVGVVGRTGSGKSSLVQALFRILEAEDGSITVDDVDISQLGLHKLRSSMSVIPQSPVLFSGCTVRENLDPFGFCSDPSIHDALERVQMKSAIAELAQGLDHVVAEGGSNFSVGQRQLLCLARALLKQTSLLVLDEPTANVDSHTDQLLQTAVKKCFEGATILAVAHRLDTVIDYDKILVLGAGKVLEFGSPKELLSKPEGHFTSMVNGTGEKMAALLYEKAGC